MAVRHGTLQCSAWRAHHRVHRQAGCLAKMCEARRPGHRPPTRVASITNRARQPPPKVAQASGHSCLTVSRLHLRLECLTSTFKCSQASQAGLADVTAAAVCCAEISSAISPGPPPITHATRLGGGGRLAPWCVAKASCFDQRNHSMLQAAQRLGPRLGVPRFTNKPSQHHMPTV